MRRNVPEEQQGSEAPRQPTLLYKHNQEGTQRTGCSQTEDIAMRHWIAKLGIAAMALCLLGLWLPGSSASAGSSSGYYVGSGTQADGGYLATTPTDPRIFDRFTVPTVTCASAPDSAIAIGVSLIGEGESIPESAGVVALCSSGTPAYHGMLAIGSFITFTGFTPAPGDIIVATAMAALSTTQVVTLTVQDVTQNQSQSRHQGGASPGAFPSALWGVQEITTTRKAAPPCPCPRSLRSG